MASAEKWFSHIAMNNFEFCAPLASYYYILNLMLLDTENKSIYLLPFTSTLIYLILNSWLPTKKINLAVHFATAILSFTYVMLENININRLWKSMTVALK